MARYVIQEYNQEMTVQEKQQDVVFDCDVCSRLCGKCRWCCIVVETQHDR